MIRARINALISFPSVDGVCVIPGATWEEIWSVRPITSNVVSAAPPLDASLVRRAWASPRESRASSTADR